MPPILHLCNRLLDILFVNFFILGLSFRPSAVKMNLYRGYSCTIACSYSYVCILHRYASARGAGFDMPPGCTTLPRSCCAAAKGGGQMYSARRPHLRPVSAPGRSCAPSAARRAPRCAPACASARPSPAWTAAAPQRRTARRLSPARISPRTG